MYVSMYDDMIPNKSTTTIDIIDIHTRITYIDK